MTIRLLILLFGIGLGTAWADFSDSEFTIHPTQPLDGPFVLEITGKWPSDCHPGEQRPIIRSYDGYSVLIEFDIIVEHVTCNDVDTPYRVLVDMSDVTGTIPGSATRLDATVVFGGFEFTETIVLDCGAIPPCQQLPAGDLKPENGAYYNHELGSQGLILSGQGEMLAAYPLIYDENGDSEWLVSGSKFRQDTYFGELFELTGGQCLGCPLPSEPPVLETAGKLTLLTDSAGVVQVKVNHGPFMEYQKLVFGYKSFPVGPSGAQQLIDLEGRWGISENRGTNPPLGDLTEFLPGVFDLVLNDIITADPQAQQSGQVTYHVFHPAGQILGELVCKGQSGPSDTRNICEFIDPTDAAEPLFLFYQDAPESLSIEYGRTVIAVGIAPGGKAVRLD